MDADFTNQNELNDVERELSRLRPSAAALDPSGMLYAAGIAVGRKQADRLLWPALCGVFVLLSGAIGVWGFQQRLECQALISQLQQSGGVHTSEFMVASDGPARQGAVQPIAANNYLAQRRRLEQDPNRLLAEWDGGHATAFGPPLPEPVVWRASQYEALSNQ